MKTKFFLFAAFCAVICSCSELGPQKEEVNIQDQVLPVVFDQYTTTPTTRATSLNKDSLMVKGFGVFAFQQDQTPLDKYVKENFMPNFMYNQQVKYNNTTKAWEYEPVKYWPNNDGAKVSFYAYAPYIADFNPKNGENADDHTLTPETNTFLQKVEPTAKEGLRLILGYDYGGPGIEYTIPSDPTNGVDLMWGDYEGSGHCAKDLERPSVDQKIKFNFKHALSRVSFMTKVFCDTVRTSSDTTFAIAPNTTIYIKKVTLKGGLPTKGTLRLCDGTWNIAKEDFASIVFDENQFAENIKDGLKDKDAIKDTALLVGTNSGEIADGADSENGKNNYVTLIPGASFQIEIVYDVVTVDTANPRNNSTVTNTILSGANYTLQAGYAYAFHLNIGMTSVKFDCDVTPWQNGSVTTEVDLPSNTVSE